MRQASYSITAALASALALSGPVLAADTAGDGIVIGTAGGLHGSVQLAAAVFDAERRPVGRQIGSGDPIYQGDLIVTGPGGGLQVMLADQTIVTLGENARMTIDEIVFNPASADGKITFGVEQGVFRFISGQVAQAKPENVNIRIPMGNIGIRGTIVGGNVNSDTAVIALLGPGGETNSSARHGAISVSTPAGSVDITRTGYATTLLPGQPPSPPAQLTPAQLQQLNKAAPPSQSQAPASPPAPGGGAELSASGVTGQSSAQGGQLASVVHSSAPSPGLGLQTQNLVGTQVATTVIDARPPAPSQPQDPVQPQDPTQPQDPVQPQEPVQPIQPPSPPTPPTPPASPPVLPLSEMIGTPLAVTPGIQFRKVQETCTLSCQNSEASHSYALIAPDGGDRTFTYTQNGVTLANLGSGGDGSVVLNEKNHNNETNVDRYSGGGSTVLYDYKNVPGLLYSTYGYFIETASDNRSRNIVALGTGNPTPSLQMPSSGSAIYSGGTAGYISAGTAQWHAGPFTGNATLTANFSTGTVSGVLSGLTASVSSVSMGNIALSNASISGNTFNGGTVSGTVTRSGIPTVVSGSFSGGFNGPNAKEVAGSYVMNNSAAVNHSTLPVTIVGSFGAKK